MSVCAGAGLNNQRAGNRDAPYFFTFLLSVRKIPWKWHKMDGRPTRSPKSRKIEEGRRGETEDKDRKRRQESVRLKSWLQYGHGHCPIFGFWSDSFAP